MGKPFKSELLLLKNTLNWASTVNIDELTHAVTLLKNTPLIAVGSGGSLSACYFACNLHQTNGHVAKAVTPLELYYTKQAINKSSVIFLSASGKNTDIITAYKNAIAEEPQHSLALILSQNTPIKKAAENFSLATVIEYKNPVGKDGFLATNSLLAFVILLYRAYGHSIETSIPSVDKTFIESLAKFTKVIDKNYTFQVLYGGYGHPVAIDIESKFSEAALGPVLYSDYRNFGHGRHHWLSKRKETCIIALVTPNDRDLAIKTLQLIPKSIPILIIETEHDSTFGTIELLVKSFYLADAIGEMQDIDPGRPGVPEFGRKLYHLKYASILKKITDANMKVAIQRKLGQASYFALTTNELKHWESAYSAYKKKISEKKYHCLVLDYDGTLCDSKNRYTGISEEMGKVINNLLEHNIQIGIATGRGKSIRSDLQKVIHKQFQNKVIIGYYNGGEIGELDNDNIPSQKPFNKNDTLDKLGKELQSLYSKLKIELKRKQLTIEFPEEMQVGERKGIVELVNSKLIPNIACIESSHSIDIILRPDVSKLNVIHHLGNIPDFNILCIGDRGRFPGNDFELLTHPTSLSVDEASSDANTCWNFAPPGLKQIDATLHYMKQISSFSGHFKITL